ncbi:MAG: recombinase family protein [Nitrospirota bacterium]
MTFDSVSRKFEPPELFAEHRRKMVMAKQLNEAGYRTRRGKQFTDVTITQLLENSTAKGLHRSHYTTRIGNKKSPVFKPQEHWVHTPVEPVVSDELWNQCHSILQEQRLSARAKAKRNDVRQDLPLQEEAGSTNGSGMKQPNGQCHFRGSSRPPA